MLDMELVEDVVEVPEATLPERQIAAEARSG
jgi:hypothetical protein